MEKNDLSDMIWRLQWIAASPLDCYGGFFTSIIQVARDKLISLGIKPWKSQQQEGE